MYFFASMRQRVGEARRLLFPLAVSLVLHALVFSPDPVVWPRLETFAGRAGDLRASLNRAQPAAPTSVQPLVNPPKTPDKAAMREPEMRHAPSAPAKTLPDVGRSNSLERSSTDMQREPMPADVDPAGLRQYQLALGRTARQFRNHPEEARERGWKGRVSLRLTLSEAGSPLGISLVSSSGYDLLDRAASDMMLRAAKLAEVPESLRGRRFSIDLAIDYNPEDSP
jgi:protein TonB